MNNIIPYNVSLYLTKIVVVGYRAELENKEDKYDVIVGDLADPIEGGPCYKLYTKSFYEQVVKPKLNSDGIFVTQVRVAKLVSRNELRV